MFCSNCGNRALDAQKFCSACGVSLATTGAQGISDFVPTAFPPLNTGQNATSFYSEQTFGTPKLNVMAVIGLALTLALCCGPGGLIFSIIGLNQIKKDPATHSGLGIAITGIVVGALWTLGLLIYLVVSLISLSSESTYSYY